jgi:isoquinoline 1-oxidoreductase subunit alpha
VRARAQSADRLFSEIQRRVTRVGARIQRSVAWPRSVSAGRAVILALFIPWRTVPGRFAREVARMIKVNVNGEVLEADADPQTPLLWVLRDTLGLTGTKYGCGMALCGACTVHLNGKAVRSCVTPISAVGEQAVTTIEGLSKDRSHPVQRAWLEIDVPQCGYCQPGQIMSAAALLAQNAQPDDEQIDAAMAGNICRCGTYPRIRAAIHRAAQLKTSG